MQVLRALLCVGACALAFVRTPADEPVELPLAPYLGPLRTVRGSVGSTPATFLFDSGGGGTMLSLAMAKTVDCAPFGRGTGFTHDGTRIDAPRGGPVDLNFATFSRRGEVGLLDLAAMGLPKIDGIVSLETFANRVLTMDLAKNRLVIETAASAAARTRNGKELKVRLGRQAAGAALDLFVAVDGKHGPLWFELDCGNTQAVLIAPHAWAELGIEPPGAGTARRVELPIAGLGSVVCALQNKEMIYDGLLDAAFCARFVLTLDLAAGRAWAVAN